MSLISVGRDTPKIKVTGHGTQRLGFGTQRLGFDSTQRRFSSPDRF